MNIYFACSITGGRELETTYQQIVGALLADDHEIPTSLATKFNQWIFGCDICQDVCPWNDKLSTPTSNPHFQPRDHTLAPKLETLSKLSEAEFRETYRGSPIKRTKWKGLTRNVDAAINVAQPPNSTDFPRSFS